MTDQELADGIAKRDEGALQILIDRFHRPLFRYLWHTGGSKEDAEDLAVQALLRIRAQIKGFRAQGSLRSWIFQIAYRELLRHRRRQAVASFFLARQSTPIQPAPSEDAIVVYQALSRIPAHHRDAFLLVEAEGLTTEEAAEALEIPPGTVKSRCHHARMKLRKLLGATYGEPNAEISHD